MLLNVDFHPRMAVTTCFMNNYNNNDSLKSSRIDEEENDSINNMLRYCQELKSCGNVVDTSLARFHKDRREIDLLKEVMLCSSHFYTRFGSSRAPFSLSSHRSPSDGGSSNKTVRTEADGADSRDYRSFSSCH